MFSSRTKAVFSDLTRLAIAVAALLVLGASSAAAQPPSGAPSKSTSESLTPAQAQASPQPSSSGSPAVASANAGFAVPAYLTPIHGVQGVLAETLDGSTIAAQALQDKFNPASSIKLATALVALQSFGPEHHFVTSVWASGAIDRTTQTLTGDLVITGRDPSFRYEHAMMLARQLNQLGIHTVTGNLIVAPGFTMNFDWSSKHSGEQLRDTFDANFRSGAATRAWLDERTMLGDKESLSSVPSVVINGEIKVDAAPTGAVSLITHRSSSLVNILKVLLCYSNNFMAERIGDTVGGPQSIETAIRQRLRINPDEFQIVSASGLGINRVSPPAMMKILRGLRSELARYKLSLADILPVAGVDPGTLEDRYTDPLSRASVIAKTGTLTHSDGGASSLVGQMQTKSGRVVLFVIFNQRGNVLRFRQNQDQIVSSIQNALGGPAPFQYRPMNLGLRLASSDYEAAKARGEYEPKNEQ
jgi:serine-type D-Ala-D-Ala carboxypeptidase/endopeptidase (penicillin-binding protein 4)